MIGKHEQIHKQEQETYFEVNTQYLSSLIQKNQKYRIVAEL